MTAAPLLLFHITAGGFALMAGSTALFARKGATLHRTAGNAFFIAMILMAVSGAVLAVVRPAAPALNLVVSLLTLYMVATSWMTVIRKEGETGAFETGAFLLVSAIAAGALIVGVATANSPTGRADGIPAPLFFFFAGIAAIAALADLSVLIRRGVAGAQRIARHLWRMGFALGLATLAFFIGQGAKIFPQAVRETGALRIPLLLVIALTLFWLARVLLTNWTKRQAAEAGS